MRYFYVFLFVVVFISNKLYVKATRIDPQVWRQLLWHPVLFSSQLHRSTFELHSPGHDQGLSTPNRRNFVAAPMPGSNPTFVARYLEIPGMSCSQSIRNSGFAWQVSSDINISAPFHRLCLASGEIKPVFLPVLGSISGDLNGTCVRLCPV